MLGRRADAARVIPGLWVGSAPSARQAQRLAGEGITAVVDLRSEGGDGGSWSDGVAVHRVPFVDHATPTVDELGAAAEIISRLLKDGHEVLVHCRAGLERSPTVVCAVLLLQGWPLSEAYRRVTESRKGAAPTEGQLATLRKLEQLRLTSAPEPV